MLQVIIDGTDISSYLISYTREKDLCSSEGIIELEIDTFLSISTYDIILAYEDSNLKGTFYVDFMEKFPDGRMTIHGRDNSKRAQDYFIPESYTAEGDTTSRYWIEFFLGMAGISYNFTTTDTGYTVQDGEMLGLTSVQEAVEQLVRYSGWYIYYNKSNVAQIGKLDYDSTSYKMAFDDTDIVTINYNRSDMYLRNRAVVWGAGYKGDQEWVFADISVDTPWNYDTTDKRAILARAGFPIPFSQAMGTAQILLNEYARLVREKTITLHGFHNLEVGEFVLINSSYFNGVGLISQINVTTTEDSGYKTTLVLDRRCPRFVGFYDIGGLVYAGTEEDGVWYKQLDGDTWYDYSTGLADLNINDLDVSYGVLSTTTAGEGYLYGRTVGDAAWVRLQPSYFYDNINLVSYPASSGIFVASNINDYDQTIYGLFTMSGIDNRTWLVQYPAVGGIPTSTLVNVSGEVNYIGVDVESTFEDIYLSVVEQGGDAINSPFAHNPKGQQINFIAAGELDTKTSNENSIYSGYNMFNITGNYVYRYDSSTNEIKRINFRLGSYKTITLSLTKTFLWFTPKNSDVGYLFEENNISITVYKIDWENETSTLVTTENFLGDPYIGGIIGSVNDNGSIRTVFSLEDGIDGDKITLPVFDCDTETFSFAYGAQVTGGFYVAGNHEIYEPYPESICDVGDGILAFIAMGSDNILVYLNTRTMETIDILIPYSSYDLSYLTKIAPDFETKDIYLLAEDYDNYFCILKVTQNGSYSLEKKYEYFVYDEDFNYQIAYNDTKVIAIFSNGIETFYYDCKNHLERSREYVREDCLFSKAIGGDGALYEVHGIFGSDPQVNLYFISDDNYYGGWDYDGTYFGTNGTALNYNSTEGWNFNLSPTVDDFVEDSLIRSRVVQGTDTSVEYLNTTNYLEDNNMYMITSEGYFVSNVGTSTYSTGFTTYGISNLGTQPGVGKHGGPTLEDCYAATLDLGDASTTTYARRASSDGNHGEIFIWYDAVVRQTYGESIGIHHGDRLDWSGDNSGEITVNVYKYIVENAITDVYYECDIKHSLSTSSVWVRINYKRIGTSTFRDSGVKPYVEINGIRYYENTLYSSTYTRYRTFNIDLGGTISITQLKVGFEIIKYSAAVAISYMGIYVDVGNYNPFSVEKVYPNVASRSLFKNDSFLADYWGQYNITYLRAIGNYMEYGIDDDYWENYPRSNVVIMHTYDNNYSGNIGKILRYRDGEFENVYALAGAHFNLDISSPSVITAYTGVTTSGTIYLDGSPYTTGSSRGDVYFSFTGDTFRHINLPTMSGSYIFDSRGFSLIDEYDNYKICIGMVVLSGLTGSVGQFSYIDVTEYEDTGSVIVFPDIHTIESFNYVPIALETSNYNYMSTPYFFVGLSGTSAPFLQRDADTEEFINRSTNFPASRITTIRLDDML